MTLNSFQFNTTAGLRFGDGLAKSLCEEISEKLGSRILFITDKGIMSLGIAKPTIDELSNRVSIEIFDNVEADPSKKTLLSAIEVGKKFSNLVKNSSTHIFEGCGHMIMIEKAFEMREKVLEFLKR